MNDELALTKISVADLLQSTPKAVRFFLDHKTACATCLLAKFCTLQDVVETYHLDRQTFVNDLAKLNVPLQK